MAVVMQTEIEAIPEGIDPRLEFPKGMVPEKGTEGDPTGNFWEFLHSCGGGTLTAPGTTLPEVSGPRTVAAPTAAPLSISPIPTKAPELCPGLVLDDSPRSVSGSDTLMGDPWELDSPASADSPLFAAFNAGQPETRKRCQKKKQDKRQQEQKQQQQPALKIEEDLEHQSLSPHVAAVPEKSGVDTISAVNSRKRGTRTSSTSTAVSTSSGTNQSGVTKPPATGKRRGRKPKPRPSQSQVRERNRVAAGRYRSRKREADDELEVQCRELEKGNRALANSVGELTAQVCELKNMLLNHSGCDNENIQRYLQVAATEWVNNQRASQV
ncbi:hypothetical protein N3K66_006319 [Trichothecium roseum]|uniref:Uncharacterized protein n=1 Tax=Trichothecium roseum TaxID=47278 RepID=A0ACC0UV43_9HYPO|nr:hypothetical protein N3K66_006319 [Trichothecium roseum]